MTPELLTSGGAPAATDLPRAGTWRLSWSGVVTVATLELRQRVRSTRWIAVLVAWAVVLGGLTALVHYAVHRTVAGSTDTAESVLDEQAGATVFGIVVLLVLALGSLVAPALSATSINGDRSAGVLATLQTTLLSPAELAVGKLAAAWLTALALLGVALPFIGWAYLDGGTPVGRLLVVVALLAVMLLVVCAVGLGWSAVTARTTTSAVLTYLTVAFLGVGLPVLFALLVPLSQTTETATVRTMEPLPTTSSLDPPPMQCVTRVETVSSVHTERIWWVLAPNPAVVLADASPRPTRLQPDDPLSAIRAGVRELRLGEQDTRNYCYVDDVTYTEQEVARQAERERLGVTWPYGLAADLALASAFFVVAVRRLRAPVHKLPRGTRIA